MQIVTSNAIKLARSPLCTKIGLLAYLRTPQQSGYNDKQCILSLYSASTVETHAIAVYYKSSKWTTELHEKLLLLGRVAVVRGVAGYSHQTLPWTICRSLRRSVGASICPVHCRKTADRILMPFGIICRTGPGIRHVVEFGDRSTGMDTFGSDFGVRHCNQWGLTFAATRPSFQITLGKLVNIH